MIGYEELVSTLASWRARQGLAETGSDFLGPRQPFPEYRVPHPTEDRSYAEPGAEADLDSDYESGLEAVGEAELEASFEGDEAEVLYADEAEATEFGEAYAPGDPDLAEGETVAPALEEYEAVSSEDDAGAEDAQPIFDETAEAVPPAEIVGEQTADSALEDYAIDESYEASVYTGEDDGEAQVDEVQVAAEDDIEGEYAVEVDDARAEAEVIAVGDGDVSVEELAGAESPPTETYEGQTQLSDPEALYAEGEATAVGSVDDLAPPAAEGDDDLDSAIDDVAIDESDSVSYGEDADPERNE